MLKKLLIIPGIVLGVSALVFLVQTREKPRQAPVAERATPVRFIKVPQVALVPRASGFGYARPARVVEIVAEVPGRIVDMREDLRKGVFVGAGDALFQIETDSSRLAVQQLEAEMMAVEAQVTELDFLEKETRRKLETETSALEINRRELARKQKLAEEGVIAQAMLDTENQNVLARKNAVENFQGALDRIPSQRRALEARHESLRMRLEDARIKLEKTALTAPFDARVAAVHVETGQAVGQGKVLAVLDSIDRAEVEAQIPRYLLRNFVPLWVLDSNVSARKAAEHKKILSGFKARILRETDTLDTVWEGRFTRFGETDARTGAVAVVVSVDDPWSKNTSRKKPPLEKNLYCEVQLSGKPLGQKIVVPRTAIHGGKVYLINKDNRLERRAVEVEFFQESLAVVKSGVKPGDKLIVQDVVPAIDSMLLTPEEDASFEKSLIAAARSVS